MLGVTGDELGGSEYYDMFGYTGLNVPKVRAEEFFPLYRKVHEAIRQGLVSSVHGIYRGGFGVHLALCAMAGELGVTADVSKMSVCGRADGRQDHLFGNAGAIYRQYSAGEQGPFDELFHGLHAVAWARWKTARPTR